MRGERPKQIDRPRVGRQKGGTVALVLLVDDDDMVLRVMSAFLGSEGHDTIAANDGHKAMEIINTRPIEVVISDMRMTPISGMELLRMIKAAKPALPVILLTAFASGKTAREARELGATGYLSKPFTNEEVLKTVEKALAGPVATPAAPATTTPAPPPPPPPPL